MDALTKRKPSIEEAVRRKWKTAEQKEWWYHKFAAVRRRKLVALSERQNHRCCYCRRQTWLFDGRLSGLQGYQSDRLPGMKKSTMATTEHLIPVSDGGTEHQSNLIMCCHRCNTVRGNRASALEFWEIMHDPVRYHEFATQGRRWKLARKKAERESTEKVQNKRRRAVIWLGYLCVMSPEFRYVFLAWDAWLDAYLQGWRDPKESVLHYYLEGISP